MKDYEIAILVRVRQRGVDESDAFNRAVHNLNIDANSVNFKPYPSPGHVEELHATRIEQYWERPIKVMAKEVK